MSHVRKSISRKIKKVMSNEWEKKISSKIPKCTHKTFHLDLLIFCQSNKMKIYISFAWWQPAQNVRRSIEESRPNKGLRESNRWRTYVRKYPYTIVLVQRYKRQKQKKRNTIQLWLMPQRESIGNNEWSAYIHFAFTLLFIEYVVRSVCVMCFE